MIKWLATLALVLIANPAFPDGWTQVPYDAANFSGSGKMTWHVPESGVTGYRYKMLGTDTMVIIVALEVGTVGGVPDTELRLKIPDGRRSAGDVLNTMVYYDDWSRRGYRQQTVGTIACTSVGQDYLQLRKIDNGKWTLSNGKTYIFGQIILDVLNKP
jgi:hypothetical protein